MLMRGLLHAAIGSCDAEAPHAAGRGGGGLRRRGLRPAGRPDPRRLDVAPVLRAERRRARGAVPRDQRRPAQGPSDLKQPDWELGAFTLEELHETLAAAQADYRAVMEHFVPAMLMDAPSAADLELLVGETQKVGANAGTCILLDQSLQDYRDVLGSYQLPTLLAWGRDEKLVPVASGEWLAERIPGELVVFERSGHCPMWEEPDRFNQVVGDWISAL
jgi:pimeloyl-ACP methyl ester carboxylesterase